MPPPRTAPVDPWRHALRHPFLYGRAVATAVAAARRVAAVFAASPFDETVRRLRDGEPLSGALADPVIHLRVVGKLLPWLPPHPMGPCMKRSLILLHLWSRCGLEPSIHIGFAADGDAWAGHAWLTADGPEGPVQAGSSDGHLEAFVY